MQETNDSGSVGTSWSVDPAGLDALMFWEAATLVFFGFMRSEKLTILSAGGFNTDQIRQGYRLVVGHTGGQAMPCNSSPRLHGSVGRKERSLFQYMSGKPHTPASFVVELKSVLERLSVCSERYSEHRGAAITRGQSG